jgi:repressor of nif and glnA expression
VKRADDIRKELLFHLYAVRPTAHLASTIQSQAKKAGLDYSLMEIEAELPFLEGEKLVERVGVAGTTETLWRITSAGVRLYEQQYAA